MDTGSFLSLLTVGVLLGLRHALEPDHVAAVVNLVTQQNNPWKAAGIGALWGLGHLLTLATVGGLILALHLPIPRGISAAMELMVALALTWLGLETLRTWNRGTFAGSAPRSPLRSPTFWGIIHGLSGSAALILLASSQMPSPLWAFLYVVVFGMGALMGMFLMSLAVGAPFVLAAKRVRRLQYLASVGVALGSLIVALTIAWNVLRGEA